MRYIIVGSLVGAQSGLRLRLRLAAPPLDEPNPTSLGRDPGMSPNRGQLSSFFKSSTSDFSPSSWAEGISRHEKMVFEEVGCLNPVVAFLLLVLVIIMNLFLFLSFGTLPKEVSWFAGTITGIILIIAWRGLTSENL